MFSSSFRTTQNRRVMDEELNIFCGIKNYFHSVKITVKFLSLTIYCHCEHTFDGSVDIERNVNSNEKQQQQQQRAVIIINLSWYFIIIECSLGGDARDDQIC